ncbi:hypothetical protein LCGC14_0740160 [marine sediment metagenome]|uniref:Uncharacterized protein n=1 Tax=marine sediment metagenome TaxID=412755 RepID=A0A0F9SRY9_9ZZZZ
MVKEVRKYINILIESEELSKITEKRKKPRKKDYSEEEWAHIKAIRAARRAVSEILSRDARDTINILDKKGYELSHQAATSIAKRMSLGMLELIDSDKNDIEKIFNQVNGAFNSTAKDHPEYGIEYQYRDQFVEIMVDLVSNNFEKYKLAVEQV